MDEQNMQNCRGCCRDHENRSSKRSLLSARSTVTQKTKQVLGLLDDDEEVTTNRNYSQKARVKSEEAKVADLIS